MKCEFEIQQLPIIFMPPAMRSLFYALISIDQIINLFCLFVCLPVYVFNPHGIKWHMTLMMFSNLIQQNVEAHSSENGIANSARKISDVWEIVWLKKKSWSWNRTNDSYFLLCRMNKNRWKNLKYAVRTRIFNEWEKITNFLMKFNTGIWIVRKTLFSSFSTML